MFTAVITKALQYCTESSITLSQELEERVDEVCKQLTLSADQMDEMRRAFVAEMAKGWEAGKGAGCPQDASSLKMLTSHMNTIPKGTEAGVYYALDLGGTNLRVLRVKLMGSEEAEVDEHRSKIPDEVMAAGATAEQLFDFIANTAKVMTDRHKDAQEMAAGFTFSFPMSQGSISSGKLVEWTKGFETQGVVGKDPAALLMAAFKRCKVPLRIVALCNDTVGTLMTCAYQFKGCSTCRIGVILGTGTNAAYVDPSLGGTIINIEWGAFDKKLPLTPFDEAVDKASPNVGRQRFEKMISGMYLGEITRHAVKYALEGRIDSPALNSHLSTKNICVVIEGGKVPGADVITNELIRRIGHLVLDRSAALTAAALAAVGEKTGSISPSGAVLRRKDSMRTDGMQLTIGIDGSVFNKGHRYPHRLTGQLQRLLGKETAAGICIVRSEDGSGVGAALVAAAVSH